MKSSFGYGTVGARQTNSPAGPAADFVARIESLRGEFLGSGFLVDARHVVTCFHVIKAHEQEDVYVVLPVAEGKPIRLIASKVGIGTAHDLALLRLSAPTPVRPLRILRGLTMSDVPRLAVVEWTAIGFGRHDAVFFRKQIRLGGDPTFTSDERDSRLMHAHIPTGIEPGFSGGPVIVSRGQGDRCCLGVCVQGGDQRAASRILMADCLIGFLEQRMQTLPESCLAAEFFYGISDVEVPPRLSGLSSRSLPRNKPHRFRLLAMAIVIALIFAVLTKYLGWYRPFSEDAARQEQHGTGRGVTDSGGVSREVAHQPQVRLYSVSLLLQSSLETPQFTVNHAVKQPVSFDGMVAHFQLPAGQYHVEASFTDTLCQADVTVPGEESVAARCGLKPIR